MVAKPRLLAVGAIGLLLSLLLLGLAGWGVEHSYERDLERCRALSDHYAPEWFWLLFIGPIGLLSLLFMAAAIFMGFRGRPSERWTPWIVLSIGLFITGGGLALSAAGLYGPCPAVH